MRKTLIPAAVGLAVMTCLTVSAASIDVTQPGSSGSINGATFSYDDPQPTGTGVIDPFLREQNDTTELGINSSIKAQIVNTIPYDNKDPVNYTHDVAISTLANLNGFWELKLDANQVANAPISLTVMKVFASDHVLSKTELATIGTGATPVPGVTLEYTLGTGNQVQISSQRGSGSGDMSVLVPNGGATTGWMYLLAGFGPIGSPLHDGTAQYQSNDGFEEWYSVNGGTPAPDSASALGLLGMALTGIEIFRRKLRA